MAASGRGGCVVIEGPLGIGKSSLLTATCEMAAELGIAVAAGQATEFDQSVPLSTLASALQTNPDLGPRVANLGGGDGPLWLMKWLGEIVEFSARSAPLVIAIDDAHWADELTSFALRMLLPAISQPPVLLLLARRPGPVRRSAQDTIDQLIAEGARCMPVGPLNADAISCLCTKVLGEPPDESLLAVLAHGGGNPFLIEEFLHGLHDAGQLAVKDGAAHMVNKQLPATFVSAVSRRLNYLSALAHRLLEAGSVLGRPFTVHEAAGLAGMAAVDLIPAAKEAVRTGVLTSDNSELAFRHDLMREAIYDALPGAVRQVLHREASMVVMDEGGSPFEVAEHVLRGGRIGDQRGLSILDQAIESVAPKAPSTAADLLVRMLALLDEHHPRRARLIAKAVRLLARVGRIKEARQLAEEGLRGGLPSAEAASLQLGLSEALKHAGQHQAVVDTTSAALAGSDVPERLRAQLLAVQAHALLRTDDFGRAGAVASEALRLAKAEGSIETIVAATTASSAAALSSGYLGEALTLARDAVVIADANGGEALQWRPRLWLARALMAMDQFGEADSVLEADLREAEQLGTGWSQPLWHYYRAELRVAACRLDDALLEAEAGIRATDQTNAQALAVPLLALLGRILLLRHDIAGARLYIARAERLVSGGVSVGPEQLAWHTAMLMEAEGRTELAFRAAGSLYDLLGRRPKLLIDDPAASVRLVRIAMLADKHEHAERAVAHAQALAERNPEVNSLRAAAAHAAGILRGNVAALRDAAAAYRSSPRSLALAGALEDAALAENAFGHRTRAVELLEDAADQYTAIGASLDSARVGKELKRWGRPRKPRAARRADATWEGLTESELRVARLVAEGLTNRQVAARLHLSPHTVDSHLRHSFTKLGVSSRVELTRRILAHEMRLAGPDGSREDVTPRRGPARLPGTRIVARHTGGGNRGSRAAHERPGAHRWRGPCGRGSRARAGPSSRPQHPHRPLAHGLTPSENGLPQRPQHGAIAPAGADRGDTGPRRATAPRPELHLEP